MKKKERIKNGKKEYLCKVCKQWKSEKEFTDFRNIRACDVCLNLTEE